MKESERNLTIEGLSRFEGGKYGEISISGIGVARGAFSAGRLAIDGIGRFRECAEVGTCTISGIGSFRGNLAADRIEVDGVIRVKGNLKVRELISDGVLHTWGDMNCEGFSATGSWRARGTAEARKIRAEGLIRVGGVMSAESIEILPDVAGRAQDIVADRIGIRPSDLYRKSLWKLLSRAVGIQPVLRVQLIEADDVDIDATQAKIVRGKRVTIGPQCSIGTIEYSESLDVHPDATVKNALQVAD